MPFVEYADIEKLIPDSIQSLLQVTATFTFFENNAAKIVRDETGVAIPAAVADRPDWVIIPMAHLITKLFAARMSGASEQMMALIESNFKWALNELKTHVVKGIAADLEYSAAGKGTKVME